MDEKLILRYAVLCSSKYITMYDATGEIPVQRTTMSCLPRTRKIIVLLIESSLYDREAKKPICNVTDKIIQRTMIVGSPCPTNMTIYNAAVEIFFLSEKG